MTELLFAPAVAAAAGQPLELDLALWHGLTPSLLLSLGTILAGWWLYRRRSAVRRALARASIEWGPAKVYSLALGG